MIETSRLGTVKVRHERSGRSSWRRQGAGVCEEADSTGQAGRSGNWQKTGWGKASTCFAGAVGGPERLGRIGVGFFFGEVTVGGERLATGFFFNLAGSTFSTRWMSE